MQLPCHFVLIFRHGLRGLLTLSDSLYGRLVILLQTEAAHPALDKVHIVAYLFILFLLLSDCPFSCAL